MNIKEFKEYYKTTMVYETYKEIKHIMTGSKLAFTAIVALIVLVGIAIGPFAYKTLHYSEVNKFESFKQNELNEKEETKTDTVLEETVYVTIAGEVKNPGMYKMTADDRIDDVIKKAGGVTDNAYTENINLAQKLTDEQYIYIMSLSEAKSKESQSYTETKFRGIVNINNATVEELCQLDGIGEATARKIIDYREQVGRFEDIMDIQNVKGIGPAKYEKIKNNITI